MDMARRVCSCTGRHASANGRLTAARDARNSDVVLKVDIVCLVDKEQLTAKTSSLRLSRLSTSSHSDHSRDSRLPHLASSPWPVPNAYFLRTRLATSFSPLQLKKLMKMTYTADNLTCEAFVS